MALSFSRPDPSQPSSVSSASFALSRRGFDQAEVRDFLRMVAAELARLQERERFLEHELRVAQRSGPSPVAALDEEVVTRLLGEEAARIIQTARDGATTIRQRAEEHALRLVREANEEAHRVREEAQLEAARVRQDAAADAESELVMAKQHGREMVVEVRAYRERVLGELARRRELAREQIEQLAHGRDRLVQSFERARIAAVDVLGELTPLLEPDEYVNLSPTTGPVPLMVPNAPPPPQRRGPAFAEPATADDRAGDDTAVTPTADLVPAAPPLGPDAAPSDGAAHPTDEVPADEVHGRIFDVEVDDPELATAADPAPAASEPVGRRVPGVIDRPVEVAAAGDADVLPEATTTDGGASAPVDAVPAEAPTVEAPDAASPGTDAANPEDPTAQPAPAEPPATGRRPSASTRAGSTGTAARKNARPAVSTDSTSSSPAAEAPRPPKGRRPTSTGPLPRETVVERPPTEPVVDISPAAPDDLGAHPDDGHDRPLAPVVSIFTGGAASAPARTPEAPPPPAAPAAPKSSVDDLFARLRAARTDTVAEQAGAGTPAPEPGTPRGRGATRGSGATTARPTAPEPTGHPVFGESAETAGAAPTPPARPSLFEKSPDEPVVQVATDDSIFGRREEVVVPLIVNAAKKLKRVLADEQNDVLAVLRRKEAVRVLDALVPTGAEHIARYTDAVGPELLEAALAGAASIDGATHSVHEKAVAAGGSVKVAAEMLADRLVDPMRERLDRAVADAAGANAELADMVRHIYREWKTQYIDALLDDVVRLAFGHGALSAVAPGTPLCWVVDPNGPACADGDDNALGGAVSAGQPFPTDHVCAPAHAGCRCMLVKAQR